MINEASSPPEFRAKIIAEVLRFVSPVPDQVSYNAMFLSVLASTGKPEEEASHEIMAATSLLIRAGVLVCDTYDPVEGSILYRAGTTVGLGKSMMTYIWDEAVFHTAAIKD